MTKSIISSCVHASHFKNVRMQENQLWQTEYTQGPKISQISYPSKEDTVEYIYIYIKEKKDVPIFVHTNSNQKCLMPS